MLKDAKWKDANDYVQMPSVFVHEQEYLFPDFSWEIDICRTTGRT